MEDLSLLKILGKEEIVTELKERFKKDKFYTCAGETLVRLTPLNGLDINRQSVAVNSSEQKTGHLFTVVDDVYQGMMGSESQNQCIIMRGISGSGKTETSKDIINRLTTIKCPDQLKKKILKIPQILEAFGNGQTALNANSSRFGLYMTLYFSQGQVAGVKVNEYLLDKWRVTEQGQGDTNFHVFYYTLAGQAFGEKVKDFRYIQNPKFFSTSGISALKIKCQALADALNVIGFTQQEQADISVILFSILSLGNINIQRSRVGEATLDSEATTTMQNVAELLGLNTMDLEEAICSNDDLVNGERVQRRLTRDEAEDARDSLAQMIYHRLFIWITYKINYLLIPASSAAHPIREIGILDFFGFEDLERNSFEQCYINFTAELIFKLFVKHAFRVTEEECRLDEVQWTGTSIPNNDDIIQLFVAKPSGLMSTVDLQTTIDGQEGEKGFMEKLVSNLEKFSSFKPPSNKQPYTFTLVHHSKKVAYDARGWLSKNQYSVSSCTVQMMQNAENALLSTLFKAKLSNRGTMTSGSTKLKPGRPEPKERHLTVTTHFKNSVLCLVEKISLFRRWFVCCIKPNTSNVAAVFDDQFVLDQLISLNVIQDLQVTRDGFVISYTHEEFLEQYQNVIGSLVSGLADNRCRSILDVCKLTGWQIGKSKVFLKLCHIKTLSELLAKHLKNGSVNSRSTEPVYDLAKPVSSEIVSESDSRIPPYATVVPKQSKAFLESDSFIQPYATVVPKQGEAFSSLAVSSSNAVIRKGSKKSGSKGLLYPSLSDELRMTASGSDESSDSDFEVLDEGFLGVRRVQFHQEEDVYGEVGTRQASVTWFKATQAKSVKQGDGRYVDWCHGIITRRDAEVLLEPKPVGCFLIRVSETRFGYTLSFRDVNRYRHYMIEQLFNGKYRVTGEPQEHNTLSELVNFYKKTKLTNWNGLLTIPCGQREGECDYCELMLTREEEEQLANLMSRARPEPSAPDYERRRETTSSLPQGATVSLPSPATIGMYASISRSVPSSQNVASNSPANLPPPLPPR